MKTMKLMRAAALVAGLMALAGSASAGDAVSGLVGAYYVPRASDNIALGGAPFDLESRGQVGGVFAEVGTDWYAGVQYERGSLNIKAKNAPFPVPDDKVSTMETRLTGGYHWNFGLGTSVSANAGYFWDSQDYKHADDSTDNGPSVGVAGSYLLTMIGGVAPLMVWADATSFSLDKSKATEVKFGLRFGLTPSLAGQVGYRMFDREWNEDKTKEQIRGMNVALAYFF
jgi:hypothetical protein